ncbi:MAG: aspartyl protease family protein [Akkermansia sp.]
MTHLFLILSLLCSLSSWGLAEDTTSFIPATSTVSDEILPLQKNPGTNLLLLQGLVNGTPCTLLVDTGASHTTFDADFIRRNFPKIHTMDIQKAGKSNVTAPARAFHIDELSFGNNRHCNFYGIILDLSAISHAMNIQLDGILGRNNLRVAPFLLSARNKSLQWLNSCPQLENLKQTKLRVSQSPQGAILVHARPKNQDADISLLMDTGASITCINPSSWRAGIIPSSPNIKATGINTPCDQPQLNKRGKATDLILSPECTLRHLTPLLLTEKDPSLLGMDFCSRFDLIIDLSLPSITILNAHPIKHPKHP